MLINKIYELQNYLNVLSASIRMPFNIIPAYDVAKASEAITIIVKDTQLLSPIISEKLNQAKDYLFRYNIDGTVNPNPVVMGQILGYLNIILEDEQTKQSEEWKCIHPLILQSSQKLYSEGNYAEAAVNAFIEINDRVKKLYQIKRPNDTEIPDNVDAMNKVFSEKNAIIEICDRTTETGRNIHNGTRFMLVGAISALRNPKSHSNDERATVTKEEAMRRLMFASLLMYKIDDAVKFSGVTE